MSNIKISVVIPIYNAEYKIIKCLRSILGQNLEEIEVICIDDNSKDNSFSVLKKEAEADNRIVILHNDKNEGTLVSRKRGVNVAKGEYIMFADNDDWYLPDVFQKLYAEIKWKKVDILMYGFRPVEVSCQDGVEIVTEQYRGYAIPKPEFFEGDNCIRIKNRLNLLWNKIIKTEICKKAYSDIQDIHMTIAEDTYACWLIHYYAKSFAAIEDICYEWNCSDGTSTYSDQSYDSFKHLCKCMSDYEKCVTDFLLSRKEFDLAEFFKNEKKEIGYNYVIGKWRKTVPIEYADEGLKSVVDIYGYEKIYRFIYAEWNKAEANNMMQVREIERLRTKNEELSLKISMLKEKNERLNSTIQKIRQSWAFRIGRFLTWIPRRVKKIINQ